MGAVVEKVWLGHGEREAVERHIYGGKSWDCRRGNAGDSV